MWLRSGIILLAFFTFFSSLVFILGITDEPVDLVSVSASGGIISFILAGIGIYYFLRWKPSVRTRVTVVASLIAILGLAYMIIGVYAGEWFPQMLSTPDWSASAPWFMRGMLISIGVWQLVLAFGFWRAHESSWTLGLDVCLICACILFIPWSPYGSEDNPLPGPSVTLDLMWFFQFLILGTVHIVLLLSIGAVKKEKGTALKP